VKRGAICTARRIDPRRAGPPLRAFGGRARASHSRDWQRKLRSRAGGGLLTDYRRKRRTAKTAGLPPMTAGLARVA
jgi:hypothetical protein